MVKSYTDTNTHTHTHTHTHARTLTETLIHTHTHTHTRTESHTDTHTRHTHYTHTHTHTYSLSLLCFLGALRPRRRDGLLGTGTEWEGDDRLKARPRKPPEKDQRDRGPPPEQWKC